MPAPADRPPARSPAHPRWMTVVLVLAGVYNLVWGAVVVLVPDLTFRLLGVDLGEDAAITLAVWQCVGMIVGVYGLGYLAAARDPARHWPIVLVGLLGKILGPIGFVDAAMRGVLPWTMGWTILTNDLAWWIPFLLMLRLAWRRSRPAGGVPDVDGVPAPVARSAGGAAT